MIPFNANEIDLDYMNAWDNRTEYALTTEQKAAFYTMERKAEIYARSFFRRLSRRDMDYTENPQIDGFKILPLTFLPFDELQEEYNRKEGKHVSGIEHGRFVRIGTPERHCIQITLPIDDHEKELSEEVKRNIRHELIHYFLFLHKYLQDDDCALFYAYCYIYDAEAYAELSDDEEKKYNYFLSILQEKSLQIVLPTELQSLLAEATILRTDSLIDEYKSREKLYLQSQKRLRDIKDAFIQRLQSDKQKPGE